MAQRFVYPDLVASPAHAARVSIANGASSATFTDVALSGTDWAGSEIWIIPDAAAPYMAGKVAEGATPGVYDNAGPLPLVFPWKGTAIVSAKFVIAKGLALADIATVADIVSKFRLNFANNAGLAYDAADETDETVMPNNSIILDRAGRKIDQRRNGVTSQFALNPDRNPKGAWQGSASRFALSIVTGNVAVNINNGPDYILTFNGNFTLQHFTNAAVNDVIDVLFVADGGPHTPAFAAGFTGEAASAIRTADGAKTRLRFIVTAETAGTSTAVTVSKIVFVENDYVEHEGVNFLSNVADNFDEPVVTAGAAVSSASWTWVPSEKGDPGSALLTATSLSSIALEAGSKVFSLAENDERGYALGSYVLAADAANPTTKYGVGRVTAYSHPSLTLSFTADDIVGSGTISDWELSLTARRGVAGTDPGVLYTWDTGTADADPGAGNIRANNADLSLATFLYVSKTSRGGSDVAAFLNGLDASTNTDKGTAILTRAADDKQAAFTYGSVTDATGYVKIAISGHAGETAFTAADAISLQPSRAGDKGADGAGTGDVSGPASATDNAIARFDTTTGKLIQNSAATVDDTGNIAANNLSGTNTGDEPTATTSAEGVVELAIGDEYRTGTAADRALTPDAVYDAAAEVTLTDAATIAVDMSTFINATVTLGGNRALANPTNEKVGQCGYFRIVQDGTGSRTLSYGTDWEFAGGTAPVLSTGAGDQDLLFYIVLAADRVFATLTKDIS